MSTLHSQSSHAGAPVAAASSPAKLTADYLRTLLDAVEKVGDFNSLVGRVRELVAEDGYLDGSLLIGEDGALRPHAPDYDSLPEEETLLPVATAEGRIGFMRYRGRRDGGSLEAGDLHLMGAISDFLAMLLRESKAVHRQRHAADILKYLIGQLPLGVVCFAMDGDLIVANQLAERMLGERGVGMLRDGIGAVPVEEAKRYRRQFEVGDHFLYAEGRILSVEGAGQVAAFVVYDMTTSKEKLRISLERDFYLSGSRGTPLVLCALRDKRTAGSAYRALKEAAAAMERAPDHLLSVDAHSCVASFTDASERGVRALLRRALPEAVRENARLSVISVPFPEAGSGDTGNELAERALASLRPIDAALRPVVGVVDAFPGVVDSLELLAGDLCGFERASLDALLAEGEHTPNVDAYLVNADELSPEDRESLRDRAVEGGAPVKFLFTTYKQPGMLRKQLGLPLGHAVLQKPFSEELVRHALEGVSV